MALVMNPGLAEKEVQVQRGKLRWGDLDEDDGKDLDFGLPPKQVIGPDENGIKKVIEYKFNDEGKMVKVTTTSRIRKLTSTTRLTKGAVERRSWAKFGDAARKDSLGSLTTVSPEYIRIERPGADDQPNGGDSLDQLGSKGGSLKVCRNCGRKDVHWTRECPYKPLAPISEGDEDEASSSTFEGHGKSSSTPKYVPAFMRSKLGGDSQRPTQRNNDENSVRVGNLPDEANEDDLRQLFQPFGAVTRVHVVYDRTTMTSKGFGFVSFVKREDAQTAINKLDRYGYGNLILKVEWAPPKKISIN